jgi:hypothetical protein
MITITLREILAAHPCYDPREKGLLPPNHDLDAPITFREIAGAVDDDDVVWCFANLPGHDGLKRHFAVDCAERVRHLLTDERSLNALAVARRYADGQATDEELSAAWDAAWGAAMDAAWDAAMDAVKAVAWAAARVVAWAATARVVAGEAAEDIARTAAWDAVKAAAGDAARDAAWDAARDAERAWQAQRVVELTDAGE